MSHVLSADYTVGAGETDCFGYCRASAVLHFLQDAATRHAQELRVSREDLLEKYGAVWLLTKQWYNLSRPLRSREDFTVQTWPRAPQGPLYYRDFDILCAGERVGQALSVWVVAEQATKKILRPSSLPEISAVNDPTRLRDRTLPKLGAAVQTEEAARREIRYSDLDINRHMNNVRYADLVCDALRLDTMPNCFVREMQINNHAECRAGECISLACAPLEPGAYYVSGTGEKGEKRFDAKIMVDRMGL